MLCVLSLKISPLCVRRIWCMRRDIETKKNKYNYTPINYYKTEL